MNNEYNSDLHVMVDLETLGEGNDAVVTQLAAVTFNPYTGKKIAMFNMFIDIADSLDKGFKPSKSTLLWWLSQDEDARKILVDTQKQASSVEVVLNEFRWFLEETFKDKLSEVKIWGNGSTFDVSKLKTHYEKLKIDLPWMFYNERDVRSIIAFNPSIKESAVFEGVKHNGIHDCYHQINYMSDTLKTISVK